MKCMISPWLLIAGLLLSCAAAAQQGCRIWRKAGVAAGYRKCAAALVPASPSRRPAYILPDKKEAWVSPLLSTVNTYSLIAGRASYGPLPEQDSLHAVFGTNTLRSLQAPIQLDEVVIKEAFKSRITPDTAIFTADSFQVTTFASAKELLRKIPGMELTADGRIIYNGTAINEISVDGTPFLNFDQEKLLQLLRGRDLDLVKIYTGKSFRSRLTGETDAHTEKGMNLVLKEEARHGYFGSEALGLGSSPLGWDNNTNIASFTQDHKVAIYFHANNNGNTSTIREPQQTDNQEMIQGRPTELAGGLHYDKSYFRDQRLSMNINYSFSNTIQNLNSSTQTNYFLPNSTMSSDASTTSRSNIYNHKIGFQANYRIAPGSYLDLSLSAGLSRTGSTGQATSEVLDSLDHQLNSSVMYSDMHGRSPSAFLNLTYLKTFPDSKRTLSVSFNPDWSTTGQEINMRTILATSDSGTTQYSEQGKRNTSTSSNYTLTASYNEPVCKSLEFNATLQTSIGQTLSNNLTFDKYKDADDVAKDTLNPLYSSRYRMNNATGRMNPVLRFQSGKVRLTAGIAIGYLSWEQFNRSSDSAYKQAFTDFLPGISASYRIGAEKYLGADYKANAQQPGPEQLQPLLDNRDPLHQIIGNPGLGQSITHSFALNFSGNKQEKNEYYNISAAYMAIKNAIVLEQFFAPDGRELSRYYNQNGNWSGSLSGNYSRSLLSRLQFRFNGNLSAGKSRNLINNILAQAWTQQLRSELQLRYAVDTSLHISCDIGFNYMANIYLANTSNNNHIFNTRSILNISYTLPSGIVLSGALNWNLVSGTNTEGDKANNVLCNIYMGKYLRKDEALMLKLFVYDVLGQNRGYMIYSDNSAQTETTFNTVTRYVMLGLVWNFTQR
ncbi:outer membrane beta-barrel protein [Chitinophagaceae bacterium MMS25-I14]